MHNADYAVSVCPSVRPSVTRCGSSVFLDAAVQLLHVRGAVCRCTVLLEHKVVTRHSAYRWQQ